MMMMMMKNDDDDDDDDDDDNDGDDGDEKDYDHFYDEMMIILYNDSDDDDDEEEENEGDHGGHQCTSTNVRTLIVPTRGKSRCGIPSLPFPQNKLALSNSNRSFVAEAWRTR